MKYIILILAFSSMTSLMAQADFDAQLKNVNTQVMTEVNNLETAIAAFKNNNANNVMANPDLIEGLTDVIDEHNYQMKRLRGKIRSIETERTAAEEAKNNPVVEEIPVPATTQPKKHKAPLKNRAMSSARKMTFIYGFGLSQLNATDEALNQKLWHSSDFEIGLGFNKPIGKSMKTSLFYGLSLNTKSVSLTDKDIINSEVDPGYVLYDSKEYDKMKVGARYLQIPLGVKFKLSKKTKLFVGGHVGYKIKGFLEKEYTDANDEDIQAIHKASFGMSDWNYGVDLSLGFGYVKLFARYDLNPLFKDGPQYNMLSFGLRTY